MQQEKIFNLPVSALGVAVPLSEDLTFGAKYTIIMALKEGGTFCVIKISKKGIEYAYK